MSAVFDHHRIGSGGSGISGDASLTLRLRGALIRAWNDMPAWARAPSTLTALWAAVALSCLVAIGMTVQGVVDRSQARQQEELQRLESTWRQHSTPSASVATPANTALTDSMPTVQR